MLIGVIDDYLLIKESEYEIKINRKFNRSSIKENYIEYIKKYNQQRVNGEIQSIEVCDNSANNDKDYILKVCELMLIFNYSIIEKGRVEQIRLMYDIAKQASQEKDEIKQDEYIRKRIIGVLSITERNTLSVILDSKNCGLIQIIDLMGTSNKEKFKAIVSQGRRELESHPDHPGILFLTVLDLFEQENFSYNDLTQRVNAAINSAFENYNISNEVILRFMAWLLNKIYSKITMRFGYKKYEELCVEILKVFDLEEFVKQIYIQNNSDQTLPAPFIKVQTIKLANDAVKVLSNKGEI